MKILPFFFILSVLMTFSPRSFAGKITKVRGRQAVVQMDNEERLRLRQRIVMANPNTGDPIGILEITRKKGTRALGKIIKGRARIGAYTSPVRTQNDLEMEYIQDEPTLAESSNDPSSEKNHRGLEEEDPNSQDRDLASIEDESPNPFDTSSNIVADPSEVSKKNRGLWGFGLGISPTTIKVQDGSYKNNLKGNNFIIKISYDKPIRRLVSLLLGGGLLPISGTEADPLLGTAKMDANYLSFEGNLRVCLSGKASDGLWFGGGLNYLKSSSRSSNVVDPSSMGDRVLFQISAGYNSGMSAEYLMYRADLLMHPSSTSASNSVNVSQYVLSAIYFFN